MAEQQESYSSTSSQALFPFKEQQQQSTRGSAEAGFVGGGGGGKEVPYLHLVMCSR